jgi:hypothetical protein
MFSNQIRTIFALIFRFAAANNIKQDSSRKTVFYGTIGMLFHFLVLLIFLTSVFFKPNVKTLFKVVFVFLITIVYFNQRLLWYFEERENF